MTDLSAGARYLLLQDPDLIAMLIQSTKLGYWIFEDSLKGNVENTGSLGGGTSPCSAVVISETSPWSPPGANSQTFPTLTVDIWCDPTRNADNSVRIDDAKTKIKKIGNQIRRSLHIEDTPGPLNPVWGTPEMLDEGRGIVIFGSQNLSGPIFSPVSDGNGMYLGTYTYGVGISE